MNQVKWLMSILIILTMSLPMSAMAQIRVNATPLTLYEYYANKGEVLPPISERAITAAQVGIFSYRGTYEQNVNLLKILLDKDNSLGYSVITNYKTTLAASLNSTQSSIKVSSVTTKDGHTITTADVGGVAYFVIEPGGNREEIVRCTGVSGSFWTGCTRGLAFYGTSTATVAANRKSHNSGSVFVMSNVHFTFDQFVDTSADETISGTKTFINSPFVPTPTLGGQAANKSYVDFGLNQGAATSTETQVGIVQLSTPAEQASNDFDAANPQVLSTKYASSTPGANFVVVSNASSTIDQGWLDLTESFTFNGGIAVNNGFTVDGSPLQSSKFGGDGSDGALNISGGTTTLDVSNTSIFIKNYTSISITGTGSLDFINPNTKGTLVILKSAGNCILTSSATPMIDMSAMGAAGGSRGTFGNNNNTDGTDSDLNLSDADHFGGKGIYLSTGGTGGTIFGASAFYTNSQGRLERKAIFLTAGSGGGAGAHSRSQGGVIAFRGGNGGRGGGAIYIECGGSLDFQGQISVNGEDGSDGEHATAGGGSGGGGGGGAGMALIVYNTLIKNSGTVLSAGGNGGNGGTRSGTSGGSSGEGAGGGGGGAFGGSGGAGGDGASGSLQGAGGGGGAGNGGDGSDGGDSQSAGGNSLGGAGGASGSSAWVIKNTVF